MIRPFVGLALNKMLTDIVVGMLPARGTKIVAENSLLFSFVANAVGSSIAVLSWSQLRTRTFEPLLVWDNKERKIESICEEVGVGAGWNGLSQLWTE